MINPALPTLIANTRALAFIVNDDSISDDDVTQRLTEALSSLHDLVVGAYEHYSIKQFPFTLAGGNAAGLGLNSVTLPTDFYKDNSVDRVTSGSSQPETVHRFEWLDRNRTARREYSLLGSTLVVNPINRAQGNYVLFYTPLPPTFMVDLAAGASVIAGDFHTSTFGVFGATGNAHELVITDGGAGFSSADIGRGIAIAGATTAANDGVRTITGIDPTLPPDTRICFCDGAPFFFESAVPGTTTYTLSTPAPTQATWSFPTMSFDQSWIGRSFTVRGSAYAGNNDTFVVTSIPDPTHVVTNNGSPITENFLSSESIQVDGTISTLPQIYQPWYEYLQVHAAVACRDSIDLPTEAQERKLAALTKRIEAMAANRMEEPGQVALTHHTGGGWDEGGYLP